MKKSKSDKFRLSFVLLVSDHVMLGYQTMSQQFTSQHTASTVRQQHMFPVKTTAAAETFSGDRKGTTEWSIIAGITGDHSK